MQYKTHKSYKSYRPYKSYRAYRAVLLAILLALPMVASAQWLPEKTHRLVNDYSHILSDDQREQLERHLVAFNDSTSNQILVVITPTLGGDDENAVAQRIGQTWGVGQKAFDNGLVILIKSKTEKENWGAVAIATGYGLEGALPDVACKHIIDDEMIPALSEGDYYGAIVEALEVIEPIVRGEYSYAEYRAAGKRRSAIGALILFGIIGIGIFLLLRYAKKHPDEFNNRGGGSGGSNGGIFFGGFPIGFGGGHGGGSFGGGFGGGGFGGFGGGGFGGGGASGRF